MTGEELDLQDLIRLSVCNNPELKAEYLNVEISKFYDWNFIFEDLYFFVENKQNHKLKEIPPRFDFFKKHESQLMEE